MKRTALYQHNIDDRLCLTTLQSKMSCLEMIVPFNRKAFYTILCTLIMISEKTYKKEDPNKRTYLPHLSYLMFTNIGNYRKSKLFLLLLISHSHLAAFSFFTICHQNANDQAHNTQMASWKTESFCLPPHTWYRK